MMKRNVIKCFSLLVALIYTFSVAGFNVHCCNTSGEIFVAPLFEGATCHDFHPDHHCRSCCSDSHLCGDCCGAGISYGGECCSDNMFRLTVAGVDRSGEGHSHHHHCTCLCGHCPLSIENGTDFFRVPETGDEIPICDAAGFPADDIRPLLAVWRI